MPLGSKVAKTVLFLVLALFVGVTNGHTQKIQLTWWWDSSPSTVDFARNELIPAFESLYPHITVEYVPITDKQDKIAAAFLGGVAPDIFGGWPEERIMLPERGMVIPLDRYLADWRDAADFVEGAWASMQYKGRTYGIPYYLDLRTIIYRKDFFEEVGIDSAQPPQTWEELLRAAKKLTRYHEDRSIQRAGLDVAPNANHFAPYLWQAGADFVNPEVTKSTMLTEDALRALAFYGSLVTEHQVSPPTGMPGAWASDFWGGRLAMIYANSAVPFRTKQNMPDVYPHVGSGLPPKDVQRAVMLHSDYLVISATCKHPEEAFEFLKFFFQTDNLERFVSKDGLTPPRKSVMRSTYARENPVLQQIILAAPFGRTQPPMENSPAFFEYTREMLTSVLSGAKSPRQAAETFGQKMNATLAEGR